MTTKYFLLSIYIILRITVLCQSTTQITDAAITSLPTTGNTSPINNAGTNSTTYFVVVNSTIINYDSVNATTIGYATVNTTAITNATGNTSPINNAGANSTTYIVAVNSSIIYYDSVNSTTIGYVNSTALSYDLVNSTTISYVAVNSTIINYDLVNSTAIGYVTINSTSIDMVNTTISYNLPGGTDEPARPGEFSSKLRMGCRFSNRKFNNKYKVTTSQEYLDFTNEIFYTMRSNLMKFFRLIMIIFISIDDDGFGGTSLNMDFVLASNTSVSSTDLSNNVKSAATTAYGSALSITSLNVTQEAVAVTPTTTPMTTTATNLTTISATTLTTIPVTTIVYDLPGATDEPARSGEYSSRVRMGCSFTSKKYHPNFKIITSQEYLDFTFEIFFTMRWNLRRFLRLIRITFISLNNGSVITDMEFNMASNTSIPSANLSNFVQNAAVAGYGNNISVQSISVTQESTLVQSTTTPTPTFPGWGIFLIILACVIVIVAVILLTIFGIKYEKSKSKNLEPYLNEPPNDRQGILLKRGKMYDSF